MKLGVQVRLGHGRIVLDGDPSPPRKSHSSPLPSFRPCLLWPRSLISATAELLLSVRFQYAFIRISTSYLVIAP